MATSKKSVRENRRRYVERLAVRGITTREIAKSLAQRGIVNPRTGEAWDHSTISRDITYLEKQWRDEMLEERDKHKGRQLKELREARRKAWEQGNIGEVRLSVAKEMELLGTKAPERKEITGKDGEALQVDARTSFMAAIEGEVDAGTATDENEDT